MATMVDYAVMGAPAMPGVLYPGCSQTPIIVVPIPLEAQGGMRFQPNSYSLALQGVLSRTDFDAILAELNGTAEEYAPNVGAHLGVLMVPLVGLPALPVLMHKLARFKREVDATCARLSSKYAARGINLRVVEVRGGYGGYGYRSGGYNTFRVDMEVAGAKAL